MARRVPAIQYLADKYGLENLGPILYRLGRTVREGKATEADLDRMIANAGGPWPAGDRSSTVRDAYTLRPVVYYLRFDRLCKIGVTTDLDQRLRNVPHDELLATEPGDANLERFRHRQFQSLHYNREWFRYEGALVKHVDRLKESVA